jgi:hypothetical protein
MRMKTDAGKEASPSQDLSALHRMLAYVEAECRRLGAEAAAEHAAMAAILVIRPASVQAARVEALH